MPQPSPTSMTPLDGLLAATRLVRGGGELPDLLAALARTVADSLRYATVVVSLHRPAWDDFEVAAAVEGDGDGLSLVLPLRHTDGHVLGTLAVGDPAGGHPRSAEELDVLAALADHAALAVQAAQEAAEAAAHGVALRQLLEVSSRITAEQATEEILRSVCAGVRDALGFQSVLTALLDPDTDRLVPGAAVGWDLGEVEQRAPVYLHEVAVLLDPAFEVEGCYLLPNDEAEQRLASRRPTHVTERNGAGPRAWDRHWLVVPLDDAGGRTIGVLWADEPVSRLLPSHDALQALRVFANEAVAALVASARLNEVRFLADHDPLTRLLNRRAFVERLESEVARATRYGHTFALVVCDLDEFKALNDRRGHLAGDEALCGFARTLQQGLRKGDEAFRIGGDEFALLLAEATEEDARLVVRRIVDESRDVQASFGVASCPQHAATAQALFRLADGALYEAKRAGTGLEFVA